MALLNEWSAAFILRPRSARTMVTMEVETYVVKKMEKYKKGAYLSEVCMDFGLFPYSSLPYLQIGIIDSTNFTQPSSLQLI